MRKLTFFLAIVLIGIVATSFAATSKWDLKVKGMHCDKCVQSIEKAIKKVEGAEFIDAKIEDKAVVIKLDESKASIDDVKKAIEEAGYEVEKAEKVKEG